MAADDQSEAWMERRRKDSTGPVSLDELVDRKDRLRSLPSVDSNNDSDDDGDDGNPVPVSYHEDCFVSIEVERSSTTMKTNR